jgi:hypothetical protein
LKRKHKIGGKLKFNFKEKDYELVDANKELLEYLAFTNKDAVFPKDHWELSIFIAYGGMSSGKTELTKNFCKLGSDLYSNSKHGFECYRTNDLEYVIDQLNKRIDERKKVLFLVFDDAIGQSAIGMNSLRTSAEESVSMEAILSEVRHKLANEDTQGRPDPRCANGFCCLIYCVQHPLRLSTFIRKNAAIQIYKNTYKEIEKEFNEIDYQFLEDITELSDKHVYKARASGLAKTRGSKVMKLYFPRVNFEIPTMIMTIDYDKWNSVMEGILKYDLFEIDAEVLKAIVQKQIREKMQIRVKNADVLEVIRQAKYRQFMNPRPKIEIEDSKKSEKLVKEIIRIAEKYQIPIQQFSGIYAKSQAQLYKDVSKIRNERELTIPVMANIKKRR